MTPAERNVAGVSDLTVADMVGWLQAAGWEPGRGRASFARLWSKSGNEVLVPVDEQAPDFGLRVNEFMTDLAAYAQSAPETLAQQMLDRGSDVFEWRASTGDGTGTLPLAVAEEFIQGIAGAYRAAAAATIRRTGHFGHRMTQRARDHARELRIGQSRPGSYIFPVITRVAALEVESGDDALIRYEKSDADRDFARRTNQLLSGALLATMKVCDTREPPTAAAINGLVVEWGVSSEMTGSIARIVDAPDMSSVQVTFTWAGDRRKADTVAFSRENSSALHIITERLRQRNQQRQMTLKATVRSLSRDRSDTRGTVRLRADVDGTERTILVYLDDEQYHLASQANDARHETYVSGTLVEQDNQAWRLEDLTRFSLDPQDPLLPRSLMMSDTNRDTDIQAIERGPQS